MKFKNSKQWLKTQILQLINWKYDNYQTEYKIKVLKTSKV